MVTNDDNRPRINLWRDGGIMERPIKRKLALKNTKYSHPLPKPLVRTPYVPPKFKQLPSIKPVPLPRIKPVPTPRNVSKKVEEIKRLTDEITPYYVPQAIREFKKELKFIPKVEIVEKEKALKKNVKSFEVGIINKCDPSIQLADTKNAILGLLNNLLDNGRGFKFSITLQMKLSKRIEDGKITKEPYFNSGPTTVINKERMSEITDMMIEKILEIIAG